MVMIRGFVGVAGGERVVLLFGWLGNISELLGGSEYSNVQ